MSQQQPSHPVNIIDFDMPFLSMVTFMVKWAIASIPALIILFSLFVILSIGAMTLIGGAVAGLAGLSGAKAPIVAQPTPTPETIPN
jgi:hypothetical protein